MSLVQTRQQPQSLLVLATVPAICLMLFLILSKDIQWASFTNEALKPYLIVCLSLSLGIGLHGLLLYFDVQKKWDKYERLAPTYAFASVMQIFFAAAILLAGALLMFFF